MTTTEKQEYQDMFEGLATAVNIGILTIEEAEERSISLIAELMDKAILEELNKQQI